MHTLTVYSPTHAQLYHDWFLPTFVATHNIEDLVAVELEQKCKSGEFRSSGWSSAMAGKISSILTELRKHPGEWLCYADCDIQFFGNIDAALSKYDMTRVDAAFQLDCQVLCAGFMVLRSCANVISWLEHVLEELKNPNSICDQIIINRTVSEHGIRVLRLGAEFFSIWRVHDDTGWPENIVMHHANYVIGIPRKLELLTRVRKHYAGLVGAGVK